MPWIGGDHFVFFQPIFNVADACLSVSVIVLFLFYARHLAMVTGGKDEQPVENQDNEPIEPES